MLFVAFFSLATYTVVTLLAPLPAQVAIPGLSQEVPVQFVVGIAALLFAYLVDWITTEVRQKREGAVLITGCDSGMGEATALHLAGRGFHVYAGCYMNESEEKLRKQCIELHGTDEKLTFLRLDVTNDESIEAAFKFVKASLVGKGPGLIGVINCAAVAYTFPIEYLPMKYYRRQMDVNFFGYVATTQKFLPLMKEATFNKPNVRRGRVIFVGTGGGVMTPTPALCSAYMASKWAGESFIQVLRQEMFLQSQRIDACMINPGVIGPTQLKDAGKKIAASLFAEAPKEAHAEYGWLYDKFADFNDKQPPTGSPHDIATAIEECLTVGRPVINNCVGIDSKITHHLWLVPSRLMEMFIRVHIFGDWRWNTN
eukprot:m.67492 g.67492  ORF g.67492 m.67492 type:complete len:369 (-) comp23821_c0_seq1:72-1178(-)